MRYYYDQNMHVELAMKNSKTITIKTGDSNMNKNIRRTISE